MVGTTLKKLKKNKCYCIKIDKDIKIEDCNGFDCGRWKKCMKKNNNDINKELKGRKKSGKEI